MDEATKPPRARRQGRAGQVLICMCVAAVGVVAVLDGAAPDVPASARGSAAVELPTPTAIPSGRADPSGRGIDIGSTDWVQRREQRLSGPNLLTSRWPSEPTCLTRESCVAWRAIVKVRSSPTAVSLTDGMLVAVETAAVTALDSHTGRKKWSTPIENWPHPGWHDSQVEVRVTDREVLVVDGAGDLLALDLDDGRPRWSAPIPGAMAVVDATRYDDVLAVAVHAPQTHNATNGREFLRREVVLAVDPDTGAVVWGPITSASVALTRAGPVLADDYASSVRGLASTDGTERWRMELEGALQTTVAVGNRVMVVAGGQAVLLDATTGEEVDRSLFEGDFRLPGRQGRVLVGGGMITFAAPDGALWSFDLDGRACCHDVWTDGSRIHVTQRDGTKVTLDRDQGTVLEPTRPAVDTSEITGSYRMSSGLLVVQSERGSHVTVYDSSSGLPLAAFLQWQPPVGVTDDGNVVLRTGGELIALRRAEEHDDGVETQASTG